MISEIIGNVNTDFILRAQTTLPTHKTLDQFVASTAPGLSPAVLAAVDVPNQ